MFSTTAKWLSTATIGPSTDTLTCLTSLQLVTFLFGKYCWFSFSICFCRLLAFIALCFVTCCRGQLLVVYNGLDKLSSLHLNAVFSLGLKADANMQTPRTQVEIGLMARDVDLVKVYVPRTIVSKFGATECNPMCITAETVTCSAETCCGTTLYGASGNTWTMVILVSWYNMFCCLAWIFCNLFWTNGRPQSSYKCDDYR